MIGTYKRIFLPLFFMIVVMGCANVTMSNTLSTSTVAETTILTTAQTPLPALTDALSFIPSKPSTMTPVSTLKPEQHQPGAVFVPELNGYFISDVKNGSLNGRIHLIDFNQSGLTTMVPWNGYSPEGTLGPSYTHDMTSTGPDAPTFSNLLYSRFMEIHYGKSISNIDKYVSKDNRKQYFINFNAGKISIPFIGSDGKNYIWDITPYTPVNEYQIMWSKADPSKDPRFFEWSLVGNSIVKQANGDYRSMIIGKDGGVIIATTSKKPFNELSMKETAVMIFGPLGSISTFDENSETTQAFINEITSAGGISHIKIDTVLASSTNSPMLSPTP